MCFSAAASFGVGAALLPAGGYCARQALRKAPRLLPLALLPVVFGFQQLAEGFVWLAIDHDDPAAATAPALVFLFFALAFWPFWIPLCASLQPLGPARLWAVRLITALSLAWAVFLYGPILLDPDRYLEVRVVYHSVQYDYFNLPLYDVVPQPLLRALYFATVAVPMVLAASGDALMRWLGLIFGASAVVSHLLYSHAFTSVWCFFAAALSATLCLVFRSPNVGQAS